jgi:DNA topoisomerase-1
VKETCPKCHGLLYKKYSKKDGTYLSCDTEGCGYKKKVEKSAEEE